MTLVMPKPDESTLLKSSSIVSGLKKISKYVLSEEEEKAVYETDGLSIHRQKPIAVVLPENTKEVSQILKYCFENNVKVVPRGAGTGLSGAALPLEDRKSTRLNSSHDQISYAVFCLKKKKNNYLYWNQ